MMRVIDGEPLPIPSPTVNFGNLDDIAPLFIVTLFASIGVGGSSGPCWGGCLAHWRQAASSQR